MPYLAMSCIFAFILSFGIGPGEQPQGLQALGLVKGPMDVWVNHGST